MTSKLFDLTGKTALITGGASGIGLAIAIGFAKQGAHVLVGSRTLEKVEGAVKEINNAASSKDGEPAAAGVALDVTSDASVDRAVKKAVDVFGGLDILVNSAGIMHKQPVLELDMADFDRVHATHVTGTLRCCKAAGQIMHEQHSGAIINIASVSSFVDLVGVTPYAAAKNAVLGLTRSLANEWAKNGVRTNAIAPGFIPTDINRKMIEGTDRGRRILECTPMGRFGTSDELAGAAIYLASDAASFVNGHTLIVDGGYLACGIGDSFAPWATPEE